MERQWLVQNRSRIQRHMLELDQFWAEMKESGVEREFWPAFGMLIGIAFSLWRAVFLAPRGKPEAVNEIEQGLKFLGILIDTNAIGFPQESENWRWAAGYYLNNAMLRLHALGTDSATRRILEGDDLLLLADFQPGRPIYNVDVQEMWERSVYGFSLVFSRMKAMYASRIEG